MIRNKIKQIVDSRGLSVYGFYKAVGISAKTAYDLYRKPDQYPSGPVVDRICKWGNLQPNDVIEYVEDQPTTPE